MPQLKTGLTSVTFRQKTPEEIIALAKKAGLNGIEWGSDVHVPPGNTELAAKIAQQTKDAGLEVLSYGSYYKAGTGMDFAPVLASAKALGAPLVRIWAGNKTYEQSTSQEFQALTDNIRCIAAAARQTGIEIAFEYHRDTATQTKEGALALLHAVADAGTGSVSASDAGVNLRSASDAGVNFGSASNIGTYWQPNPELPQAEHLRELDSILPYLKNIHVFYWDKDNRRYPLKDGTGCWEAYLMQIRKSPSDHNLILEFVQNDSEDAFFRDARTLLELISIN